MATILHPDDPRCAEILDVSQDEAKAMCKSRIHIGFDSIISAVCEMKGRHDIELRSLKILFEILKGNEDLNFALYEDGSRFNLEILYEKPEDHQYVWGKQDLGHLVCYRYNGEKVVFYNLESRDVAELTGIKGVKGSLGYRIDRDAWFYIKESQYTLEIQQNQYKSSEAVKKYDL